MLFLTLYESNLSQKVTPITAFFEKRDAGPMKKPLHFGSGSSQREFEERREIERGSSME